MAATIHDVAKFSGFSKTTVSRVFIEPEKVREDTKEKIFEACKTLNYSPNAIARAMVRQKNENIAFIVYEKHYPITLNPFYSAIFEYVQMEADKKGYHVYIIPSGEGKKSSNALFSRKRVDGVIIAGQSDAEMVLSFKRDNIPVVLVNNHLDIEGVFSITSDEKGGTKQALEHLIKKGHKKIGLISGKLNPYVSAIRYNTYMEYMARAGLSVSENFIRTVEAEQSVAMDCAIELLSQKDKPTALFCTNDVIAIATIKAILRMGLRVPEDIAVVGYDGSSMCTVVEPELTSVAIDTKEMGKQGARQLISLINGEENGKNIVLKTKLVVRQSS